MQIKSTSWLLSLVLTLSCCNGCENTFGTIDAPRLQVENHQIEKIDEQEHAFGEVDQAPYTLASCSTTSCHGRENPNPASNLQAGSRALTPECWCDESQLWYNVDPHVKSYLALFDEHSKSIINKLQEKEPQPAYQNARCLSCHAPQLLPYIKLDKVKLDKVKLDKVKHDTEKLNHLASSEANQSTQMVMGTECSQCHGLGVTWVNQHLAWDEKTKHGENQVAFNAGYQPLKTTQQRMQLCVSCHIGDPGDSKAELAGLQVPRIVNHDLIAAGHPRLHFDYLSYYQALGKHWNHTNSEETETVSVWLAAQLLSLKAKVKLLAVHTMETPPENIVWPELSEMSCFSCHQEFFVDYLDNRVHDQHGKKQIYREFLWSNEFAELFTITASALQTIAKVDELQDTIESIQQDINAISEEIDISVLPDKQLIRKHALRIVESLEKLEQSSFLNELITRGQQAKMANVVIQKIIDVLPTEVAESQLQWEQIVSRVQALRVMTNYLQAGQPESNLIIELESKIAEQLDFPRDQKQNYLKHSPANFYQQKESLIETLKKLKESLLEQ